ncbi:MAG: hypothetical protein MUF48_22470 [Pirellulaceae bacterium]|nr:hypothetical protein [Pirellulaceae bacterium]
MDLLNKHEEQVGRGLAYPLWKNFPFNEVFIQKDTNVGYGWMMNPMNLPNCPVNTTTVGDYNGFRCYTDSAEYIRPTLASEYDGPPALRLFATTDNQEAWAQACNGAEPFVISDTAAECRDLVFEVCFRAVNITVTKGGFFIGLMEAGTAAENTIADAGTLADKDMIGLFKPEGNTSGIDFVYNKAGAGGVTTHVDDFATIAALTWYRFGFRFNAATRIITPWWGTGDNTTTAFKPKTTTATGIIAATSIAAATFPDSEYLAPLVGVKNAHADDYYIDIRSWAVGQLSKAAD